MERKFSFGHWLFEGKDLNVSIEGLLLVTIQWQKELSHLSTIITQSIQKSHVI